MYQIYPLALMEVKNLNNIPLFLLMWYLSAIDNTRVCDANLFECDSGKCIPIHWLCDTDLDCPGGEDESRCCKCVVISDDSLFQMFTTVSLSNLPHREDESRCCECVFGSDDSVL